MIFFFTGTGNCLYVAKKMETHPISISRNDVALAGDSVKEWLSDLNLQQ